MANGPAVSGVVGNTFSPTDVESNSTTPIIPITETITTASDNPGVISVVDSPASLATAVGSGTANVTRLGATTGLSSTTTFTITGGVGPVPTDLTSTWAPNAARRH